VAGRWRAADVADAVQVQALFAQTELQFGGVDIVAAAAGMTRPALLADATDADFSDHAAVNIRGTFNVVREAARRVRDGGRIVTVSSTTVALNDPAMASTTPPRARWRGSPGSWPKRSGPAASR